jgi:hypothetical protein
MTPTQARVPAARLPLKTWLRKVATFLIVATILGWFYGWASPWAFPREQRAGFSYGMLHGALMPMALPSLVMGKDVDIYAPDNSGRPYKLGYIVGINVCGLVFFGSAFWRPARKAPRTPLEDDPTSHKNQLR